jgi:uncharacterized protein YigA (DUF484 family)
MSDWLSIRLERLKKREEEIDNQLTEVEDLLIENRHTIKGLSEPLRQLVDNADRPTHAIQTWNHSLTLAKGSLQLKDTGNPNELHWGDFK